MAIDEPRLPAPHDLVDRVARDLADGLARIEQAWRTEADARQAEAVEAATMALQADAEHLVAEAIERARAAWQVEADERRTTAEGALRAEFEARLAVAEAQAAEAVAALAEATASERGGERESKLSDFSKLLAAVERLDRSRSLRETLDGLADGVTADAARAMVWLVRDGHLRPWRFHGFADAPAEGADLHVALDDAGPLADVVRAKRPAEVRPEAFGEETSAALAFAHLPHAQAGYALPVMVGDAPVAIVYVDDGGLSDRTVPDVWPEAAEILVRHASRCLEALTVARTASLGGVRPHFSVGPRTSNAGEVASSPAEHAREGEDEVDAARRYARLVLSELRLEHETDVKVGRLNRDLHTRLRVPIAAARERYDRRVPAHVPERHRYFEEEVVRTLADGNADMLGTADSA